MGADRTSEAVDFAWLEAYAAHDQALVREVLTIFRVEATEWVRKLRPDGPWREAAHTMKGTARTIGAASLGDVCEQAEREGEGRLPDVRAELARTLGEIAGYLERGRA